MAGKPRSRVKCGAKTKTTGKPCQRPLYYGSHRCIMHSGPLTVEGKRHSLEALARGRQTVIRNRLARQSPLGGGEAGVPPETP
jgi:hypothetical protein